MYTPWQLVCNNSQTATNYPLNSNAPIPFWDKIRIRKNNKAAAQVKNGGNIMSKSSTVVQNEKSGETRKATAADGKKSN